MAIEISGNSGRPPQEAAEAGKSQATAPRRTARQRQAPLPGRAFGADQLKLSDQAAQLQALEAEIANLPVVDTQRVQDVQRTLATGSYEIQPARVADKVLTFEAGLGKAYRTMESAQLIKAFTATVQASLHGLQSIEPVLQT